jgi:hypothetical protein
MGNFCYCANPDCARFKSMKAKQIGGTMIPELLKAWIGGFVRWALAGVFGHLVMKGIISAENAEATLVWGIAAIATLAWSLYQKWRAHQKIEAKPTETVNNFDSRLRLVLIPLLIGSLVTQACGNKTTLDRVGAVVVAAVSAYSNEIDQLRAQGLISETKYNRAKEKAGAIRLKAEEFNRILSGFAEIRPGDTPAILQQINALAGLVDASLSDTALGDLAQNSKPIKALRYIRATLDAASIVVAGLFPPPVAGVQSRPAVRPAVIPSQVVVNLPARPR